MKIIIALGVAAGAGLIYVAYKEIEYRKRWRI